MFLYPWGDMHSLNLGWFLLQFKDWVEKIQEYLDNGGGTSENLANVIAPVFNAANYYSTGDYVLYNNELYKANQAVNPGTWDPNAWTRCLIVDEMGSGGVDNVARLMIAGQYSASYGYQKYAICRYNDKLWMCNTNLPSGGETWNPAHWDEITVGAGLTGLRRSVETLSEDIVTINSALASVKNKEYITMPLSQSMFEVGKLTETGTTATDNTRIRTINYINTDGYRSLYVTPQSGFFIQVCFYNSSSTMVGRTEWITDEAKLAIPNNTTKIKWQIRTSGGGSASLSDYSKVSVAWCYPLVNGKNTLTTPVRMVMIGDSIGKGICSVSSSAEAQGQGWAEMLAINNGWEFLNLSHGGMGYLTQGSSDPTTLEEVLTTVSGLTPNYYNLFVIQLGINDYLTSGVDISGITQKVRNIASTISNVSALARVVIFSPFNASKYGSAATNFCYGTENDGRTLKEVCDTIEAACIGRGIEYIDVCRNLLNTYVLNLCLLDKVHPRQMLYCELAKIMQRFIS